MRKLSLRDPTSVAQSHLMVSGRPLVPTSVLVSPLPLGSTEATAVIWSVLSTCCIRSSHREFSSCQT